MRYHRLFYRSFLLSFVGTGLLLAEPSVYGYRGSTASDDNGYSSHGRKPAKVVITQNRDNIARLKRRIANLEERVDGLSSLVEGLSVTINELQAPGRMQTSHAGTSGTDNTALLKELGAMIDKINENYVSKEELERILVPSGKSVAHKEEKKTVSSQKAPLEKSSSAKLYSEGVRLFQKKRYNEAKKRFTITDTKGYKPAASNYYLGEIAYYTKKYDDAIFYFKKSAGLYDQASYIDTLLLHTGVSLEKTGDKAQAKAFYENIIENYPGKKSAAIAKDRLKKL